MKDELLEHVKKVVQELHIDVRMEVVAEYMESIGIDSDDILITPSGLFDRKHEKDIEKISLFETRTGKEYAQIKVSREGIYNSLPQAITHSGKRSRGTIKTTAEMIEEVRIGREEEKAARLFFQPFENEFYHQLVDLETEEQNIIKGFSKDSRYARLLNDFWQLPDILNTRQKAIFTYLIPVIHRIAGNVSHIRLCYEAILGQTVSFSYVPSEIFTIKNPFSLGNDEQVLGVSLVLGNSFTFNRQSVQIDIGPIDDDVIAEFLPDEKGRRILNFLNEYFLPADLNVIVRIIPAGIRKLRLSTQTEPSHLGYNLVL